MKILITAGGTSESIDSVRKITNTATGRLGCCIAEEFCRQAGDSIETIYYVCEKGSVQPQLPNVEVVYTQGVDSLAETLKSILDGQRIQAVVHSMAVSDYGVKGLATAESLSAVIADGFMRDFEDGTSDKQLLISKITTYITENNSFIDNSSKVGSNEKNLMLFMKQTPKVIGLIKSLQPETLLVGFKLLNGVPRETLLNAAHALLMRNGCSMVFANDLQNINEQTHNGMLVYPDETYKELSGKQSIASETVAEVLKQLKAGV